MPGFLGIFLFVLRNLMKIKQPYIVFFCLNIKMKKTTIYPLLKSSLEFTSYVVNFTKSLEQNDRSPIAKKLLDASIKINTYLYEAKTAIREADILQKMSKAKESAEETIYWFQQCVKSNYFDNDPFFVRRGNRLIDNIESSTSISE